MHPSQPTGVGRSRWPIWLLMGAVAALLALVVLPRFHTRAASGSSQRLETTARATRRDFAPLLRLNGTTQAAHSYAAVTPLLEGAQIGALVITRLVASGAHVKVSDVLVEFDAQAQVRDYLDKQNTFVSLTAQVAQKQAEEDIARSKDDSALKQAEGDLHRAELEVQKNEIVSRIDAEKNEQALEEAQATLKQLRETYDHKRKSAAAAMRILELQRDRARKAMQYAQANSSRMTLRSPMEGVAVFNTIWLGERMRTVELGDSVQPGVPILQVVDPSKMEVRSEVNEVDVSRLWIGQRAHIRLDAYPGLVLPGVLQELSPLGHSGQFSNTVRKFAARFQVQGEDPRLLPDLSAAIDFDLGEQKGTLVVPRDAVRVESGAEWVYRQTTTGFEKRAVKVASRSDDEVAVASGLVEGDVVKRHVSDDAPGLLK